MITERFGGKFSLLGKQTFLHFRIQSCAYMRSEFNKEKRGKISPSVDALTATNLSKFSSTSTLIASERDSKDVRKLEIPKARSWYVALGCATDRNVFGLNDFEDRRMAASVRGNRTHVRLFEDIINSIERTRLWIYVS